MRIKRFIIAKINIMVIATQHGVCGFDSQRGRVMTQLFEHLRLISYCTKIRFILNGYQ